MVYVFGVIGFFGGFALGQMILYFLLRHRSRAELLTDQSLKWTYGLINWIIAGIGAYSFVFMYNQYYGGL
ncbi:MAG: hypothetical protein IT558_00345 [Alphaproteobacteria bacterium]|nr:hypothetical protein [Alphaproteobacteria bacterium]